jgi:hypothetical protein
MELPDAPMLAGPVMPDGDGPGAGCMPICALPTGGDAPLPRTELRAGAKVVKDGTLIGAVAGATGTV